MFTCREYHSRQGASAQHGVVFLLRSGAQPGKLPIIERGEETQGDGRGGHGAPLGVYRFAVEKMLCRLRIFGAPLRRGPKHIEERFVGSLSVEYRTHRGASFILRQKVVTHHAPVHFFLGAHKTAGKLETIIAMQIIDEAVSLLQKFQLLFGERSYTAACLQIIEKFCILLFQMAVSESEFVHAAKLSELTIERAECIGKSKFTQRAECVLAKSEIGDSIHCRGM